jgi:hypothetical protein
MVFFTIFNTKATMIAYFENGNKMQQNENSFI